MTHVIRPADERDLSSIIAEAASAQTPLEILGSGTKRTVGRPQQTGAAISTTRLDGITLYEPSELVISALAGTPLREIEEMLLDNGQALAFEPIDLGPAFNESARQGTIGSVFATNLSGSRRISSGSARDHLIGVRAFNGNGEHFKSGGRVMKNVTGYDLCKCLSGSWGTLAVMAEVTMKVLPIAEETQTILVMGLNSEIAIQAMCAAVKSPFEVSGTVHLDSWFTSLLTDKELSESDQSLTAIRVENFSRSVDYRIGRLKDILRPFGELSALDHDQSLSFWADMKVVKFLQGYNDPVWRISTAPDKGAKLLTSVRNHHPDAKAVLDWSGGLIWLIMPATSDAGAFDIRRALAEFGGYATLIRADAALRASVDVFQPMEPGLEELTRLIKTSFDPKGILNPGRMYARV